MDIVPFTPAHLRALVLQEAQAGFSACFTDEAYGRGLAESDAFTALHGDRVIGCAGVLQQWENRGLAWALLADDAGRHMAGVVRSIGRYLDICPMRRVEAFVDVDFEAGQRMIRMLGFEHEGRARAYSPDGKDCDLFARVRGRL